MPRLGTLPVLGDYWDGRASVNSEATSWLGVALVALGALGGALPSVGAVKDLLAGVPGGLLVSATLVPGLILAALLYTVSARTPSTSILVADLRASAFVYRYDKVPRRLAKIASIPLILLTAHGLSGLTPNGLVRRNHLSGFVCKSDGAALSDGVVEALNIEGRVVSEQAEPINSDGYYYLSLPWWSTKPARIRIGANACWTGSKDLTDKEPGRGCVASPTLQERKEPLYLIEVECKVEKKVNEK